MGANGASLDSLLLPPVQDLAVKSFLKPPGIGACPSFFFRNVPNFQ